jgi:mannose-1-phosphate guanylyltransferase
MLELHRSNGGIGTLALWEVEDPTRFGIVGVNDEHRIERFMEKPKPEQVFSNLINAGSYIFEDDVFDWMPHGRHSIERDVFPKLAEANLLNGKQFEGYFIDAGTPTAWMEGVQRCIREERFSTGRAVDGTWYAKQSDYPSATISGSMIEADVLIEQASIESSTLLAHTKVGLNAQISNSLVGRSATIGHDVILDGVVVDHDSIIPDGTVQEGGQWPKVDTAA